MSLTAGAISLLSVQSIAAQLSATAATSGTAPYTYQWSRSTVTGFTPGAGNRISGATALTLNDTGLIPNTVYYYKLEVTDSAGSPATVIYSQVAVTTAGRTLEQNAFGPSMVAGTVDQKFATGTIPVVVHSSQSTRLAPGAAVKIVDEVGGVPSVVGCTANADDCAGFLNFDGKRGSYAAGDAVEMSGNGNVVYLYSTGAISRGAQVTLDVVGAPASVAQAVGSSGAAIVGWAFDKAPGHGTLIRVHLKVPGFTKA